MGRDIRPRKPHIKCMGDLTDELLDTIYGMTDFAGATGSHTRSMAAEIMRHRAAMKRLEAWADALDGDGPEDGGSYANLRFAAELRNRTKGDSK